MIRYSKIQVAFHKAHKSCRSKWTLQDSFPDPNIANEYLNPRADYSASKFSWHIPDHERLRSYCASKLGWHDKDVDGQIAPVIARLSKGELQVRSIS